MARPRQSALLFACIAFSFFSRKMKSGDKIIKGLYITGLFTILTLLGFIVYQIPMLYDVSLNNVGVNH